MEKFYLKYRRLLVTGFEALVICLAMTAAFLLRFEFTIPPTETGHLRSGILLAIGCKLIVFWMLGSVRLSWRRVSTADLVRIMYSNMLASIVFGVAARILLGPGFPRSIYVLDFLLCIAMKTSVRILVRFACENLRRERKQAPHARVLLYGAGIGADTLIRELRSSRSLNYQVIGILDDDSLKRDISVQGVPVLGTGRMAPAIIDRLRRRGMPVDEIIIAIASASGEQMREVVANCRAAGVRFRTVPSIGELLTGKVLTSQIREVRLEDLLGRDPVHLDENVIRSTIEGRSVMVTGGGGSIGSELCRQIARFNPARLVIFERAESDLFRINNQVAELFAGLEIVQQIGDIRSRRNVERALERHRVQTVYHAAAFKHVPLMEDHLLEGAENNVVGTYNLVRAAAAFGVDRFVQISTDKAVNPTNIMGLTKRVAELVVGAMPGANVGHTKFVSVRFGNVLGSNGSVVPIFRQQIASGGPVTVTHPEMKRYFMTIPEAVQLVLQASTMGKGGEIFVLDMGEPVPIVQLARNMIRLSGYEPGVDIEIRYTGLRPGEKLFEELACSGENVLPTYHQKIRIFQGPRIDREQMERLVEGLRRCLARQDESSVLHLLSGVVPEYTPSDRWRAVIAQVRRKPLRMAAAV